uniref:Uncharacterized protein n=1 Tax=Ditylum brightwellii TaxID=49249 RepID=A0A6U3U4J8_9STRA|mmetsp:Transcript_1034/g.1698  ORF Transcript_1034/g.1698 Transcript_1034/m.1698 type:complete len:363 (+) Transcript_1034:8-1096(+)
MSRRATFPPDDGNSHKEDSHYNNTSAGATQDIELCNLIDPYYSNINKNDMIFDEEAVITKVRQNPNVARVENTFAHQLRWQTCYPLHGAITLGWSLDVVKCLFDVFPEAIQEKCFVYGKHQTPLHLACASRKPSADVVSFLIETWPNIINELDSDGFLPLHTACFNRAPQDIILILVEKGPAALRVKTRHGATPLHIACAESIQLESVSLLLDKWPAAAREKTLRGHTPLHHACQTTTLSTEKIKILLEQYPKAVCDRDWEGRTPLECHFVTHESSQLLEDMYIVLRNEGDNEVAEYIMTKFRLMKWWGGVAVVLDFCPTVKLALDDCSRLVPNFLSFVGGRCKLRTMYKILCSRQDILSID